MLICDAECVSIEASFAVTTRSDFMHFRWRNRVSPIWTRLSRFCGGFGLGGCTLRTEMNVWYAVIRRNNPMQTIGRRRFPPSARPLPHYTGGRTEGLRFRGLLCFVLVAGDEAVVIARQLRRVRERPWTSCPSVHSWAISDRRILIHQDANNVTAVSAQSP